MKKTFEVPAVEVVRFEQEAIMISNIVTYNMGWDGTQGVSKSVWTTKDDSVFGE